MGDAIQVALHFGQTLSLRICPPGGATAGLPDSLSGAGFGGSGLVAFGGAGGSGLRFLPG